MPLSEAQQTKTVEIEPPEAVVERARKRAGDDDIEPYLLDEYLFEYEWIGVDDDAEGV
jgi:hypothetical protein